MSSQLTEFRLYRYASLGSGCAHDVLVRVNRPAYPNADQAADNAAEHFAESAADHLRNWWQRWLLPRDCRQEHHGLQLTTLYEPITGDLAGAGLRRLTVWVVNVDDDQLFGVAATETEFWLLLEEYLGEPPPVPRPPTTVHNVYFLTERDGELDLRDA